MKYQALRDQLKRRGYIDASVWKNLDTGPQLVEWVHPVKAASLMVMVDGEQAKSIFQQTEVLDMLRLEREMIQSLKQET